MHFASNNLDVFLTQLTVALYWQSTAVAERLPVVKVWEPTQFVYFVESETGLESISVPGLQYDTDFSSVAKEIK